ncbi:hypothetical protein DIURU_001956 [Diutina rugosa]|uniref:Globin domain-containing protein n=1 Tax=Diutina rugosa TaxID=5481 RepID=A0A642US88_DIURU|nr:uncharacterized protein DIURU_001956 [Diutina rugosa]KAA8904375.1 hypothetical protein DIURU_001956 [Diutina rugosa]
MPMPMPTLDHEVKTKSRLSQVARPPKSMLQKPLPESPASESPTPLGAGYQLSRVSTTKTVDSARYQVDTQYRVKLQLSAKEIELLRYSWNKMLMDEPITERKSVFPQMPGAFAMEEEKEVSRPQVRQTSSSTVASSLFCRQLYTNLLQMKPVYGKMFPSIHHQAVSFAGVISFALSQLERLDAIDQYLCNLGKRHSRILGIEPEMFETLGEALIDTFHERFGIRFTQELEVLWIQLYMYLANSILQFGMDPKLRLDDSPHAAPSVEQSSQVQQPAESIFSTEESVMDLDSKRGSVLTQSTAPSVAETPVPAKPVKESSLGSMKTKIRKTRRDCVIM